MARKNAHARPVMTNSAAIRVLYDLAGGRAKTWPALARDLDINVDDIYKRNRPWPSDFGRLRYRDAFEKYANEVHTSNYATILAVRKSLQSSNAYTDEVKLIVENVRADSNESLIKNSLDRLVDTIIETARPYNEIARDQTPPAPAAEKPGAPAPAIPSEPACPGAPAQPAFGEPARALTPRLLAAMLSGGDVAGTPWHQALAGAAANARPPAPATAGQRVAPRVPADAERFVGAVLPPALVAAVAQANAFDALMEGAADAGLLDNLEELLCSDSGLGCRTIARNCGELMARANAGAFFANADYLLDQVERAAGAAGAPLGHARSFYLRHGDGDCGRSLFALVLVAFLGPQRMRRVVECPQTSYLFER